jgi:hypothetical protein
LLDADVVEGDMGEAGALELVDPCAPLRRVVAEHERPLEVLLAD